MNKKPLKEMKKNINPAGSWVIIFLDVWHPDAKVNNSCACVQAGVV